MTFDELQNLAERLEQLNTTEHFPEIDAIPNIIEQRVQQLQRTSQQQLVAILDRYERRFDTMRRSQIEQVSNVPAQLKNFQVVSKFFHLNFILIFVSSGI